MIKFIRTFLFERFNHDLCSKRFLFSNLKKKISTKFLPYWFSNVRRETITVVNVLIHTHTFLRNFA